jgi:hypothetical protein
MKHIKIAVIITPISNIIQILEQTHRKYDFGENGSSSFTARNGLQLESNISPEFYPINHDINNSVLCVRGSAKILDTIFIPIDSMRNVERIIEAVNEYNNYFFNEEDKKDKSCSIEIIG